jgi:hypothetical protein
VASDTEIQPAIRWLDSHSRLKFRAESPIRARTFVLDRTLFRVDPRGSNAYFCVFFAIILRAGLKAGARYRNCFQRTSAIRFDLHSREPSDRFVVRSAATMSHV